MPRVPVYQGQRVGPTNAERLDALPPAYQDIRTNLEMFGADRARSLMEAGRGLGSLGETLGAIAESEQARANETAAAKARTGLNQFVIDQVYGENGFMSLQGEAAVNAHAEYQASFNRQLQSLRESLPTAEAQRIFDESVEARIMQVQRATAAHVGAERRAMETAVYGAELSTAARNALAAWNNPELLEGLVDEGQDIIRAYNASRGQPAVVSDDQAAGFRQGIYDDVAGLVARQSPQTILGLSGGAQFQGTAPQRMDAVSDDLWSALIAQESSGDPSAVNEESGAAGIAQVLPSTARDIARDLGETAVAEMSDTEITEWLQVRENGERYGRFYLNQKLQEFGGDVVLAVTAYAEGAGAVRSWLREYGDPRQTGDYAGWLATVPFQNERYTVKVLGRMGASPGVTVATMSEPGPDAPAWWRGASPQARAAAWRTASTWQEQQDRLARAALGGRVDNAVAALNAGETPTDLPGEDEIRATFGAEAGPVIDALEGAERFGREYGRIAYAGLGEIAAILNEREEALAASSDFAADAAELDALRSAAADRILPGLENDIARLRAGQDLGELPDRTLMVQIFGEDVANEIMDGLADARRFGSEAAELRTASADRLQEIVDARRDELAGAVDFETAARDLQTLEAAIDARDRALIDDPGRYALGSPTVRGAYEQWREAMEAGSDDAAALGRSVIRMSLDEQERLGLPPWQQRPLSNAMAASTVAQFDNALRAGQTAEVVQLLQAQASMYGDHWPQIVAQLREAGLPARATVLTTMTDPAQEPAAVRLVELNDEAVGVMRDALESGDRTALNEAITRELSMFARSLPIGDLSIAGDFADSVDRLALAAITGGATIDDAVRDASRMVLLGYEFAESGGHVTRVPRENASPGVMRLLRSRDFSRHGPFNVESIDPSLTPEQVQDEFADALSLWGGWITAPDESGILLVDGHDRVIERADGEPVFLTWQQAAEVGRDVTIYTREQLEVFGNTPMPGQLGLQQ